MQSYLITNKLYADNKGTTYSYESDGKLASRTWARGITTTYSYTNTGEMVGIDYADSTPDITFTVDRMGRQKTVTDAQGTRIFAYGPSLNLTNETIVTDGVTNVIARTQDAYGRENGLTVGSDYQLAYGFDGVGRLSQVDAAVLGVTNNWQYSYLSGSDLIAGVSNSVAGVSSVRGYEANRDLITSIQNMAGTNLISQFDYENDVLGRRTQRIDAGASVATNDFLYNARSELTNAVMGANSYAWVLDNIGNRKTYVTNGVTHTYTANALNQYTEITNGGLKTLTYDLDGNLVTDGTWTNTWNGENRAVRIEPMTPSNGSERVDLAYDYQGRRYKEEISVYSGSAWSVVRTNLWLYDGWNPVQEVVLTASGTETNWWTHGLDLSGTLQGAGGIGGFLAWTRSSDGKTFLYSADANGNITELVDASNPTNIVAAYQWDAYGDAVAATGDEAENNVFRWSSKYVIVQSGDKDFGYRILRDHRWISRDLIEEQGGVNLYEFVGNGPVNHVDKHGKFKLVNIRNKELQPRFCGGYHFKRRWEIHPNEARFEKMTHGFIVQKMTVHIEIETTAGYEGPAPETIHMEWWEAFEFDKDNGGWVQRGPDNTMGRRQGRASINEGLTSQIDRWINPDGKKCTKGQGYQEGIAVFYNELSLPNPPWKPGDGKPPWGWAPHVDGGDWPAKLPGIGQSNVWIDKLTFSWSCPVGLNLTKTEFEPHK